MIWSQKHLHLPISPITVHTPRSTANRFALNRRAIVFFLGILVSGTLILTHSDEGAVGNGEGTQKGWRVYSDSVQDVWHKQAEVWSAKGKEWWGISGDRHGHWPGIGKEKEDSSDTVDGPAPALELESSLSEQEEEEVVSTPPVVSDTDIEDPTTTTTEIATLPICERTMLYKFAGAHGFGSEFGIYLRVAAIAAYYNYTLLVNDDKWNYGTIGDYFEPPALTCTPPADWKDRRRRKAGMYSNEGTLVNSLSRVPRWVKEPHVRALRDVTYIDALFVRLFVNEKVLYQLHREEIRADQLATPPLSGTQTLMPVFEKSFEAMAKGMDQLWRPNQKLNGLIEDLEGALGWDKGGVGAQLENTGQVTIAVHVRLGDKMGELKQYTPSGFAPSAYVPRIHRRSPQTLAPEEQAASDAQADKKRIKAYFAAAKSIYEDIVRETGKGMGMKPRLLLMSDDPEAVDRFRGAKEAGMWEVVGARQMAPVPVSLVVPTSLEVEEGVTSRMVKRGARRQEEGSDDGDVGGEDETVEQAIVYPAGFQEGDFNAKPEAVRISETLEFVRDLTVLGRRSDGVVFTGSSNVGKLLAVLGGVEKAMGSKGRRMRSLDVRWFPTARLI